MRWGGFGIDDFVVYIGGVGISLPGMNHIGGLIAYR